MSLDLSSIITQGHGEYIAYHYNPKKSICEPPDSPTYGRIFSIFEDFREHMHLGLLSEARVLSRYEYLSARVKLISPDLHLSFIPRSLYELTFLQLAVLEELHRQEECVYSNLDTRKILYGMRRFKDSMPCESLAKLAREMESIKGDTFCWHEAFHPFNPEEHRYDPKTLKLAEALNTHFVSLLRTFASPRLNLDEIFTLTHETFTTFTSLPSSQERLLSASELVKNLSSDKETGECRYPMYLGKKGQRLVLTCITLECAAQKHFLLYRGGDLGLPSGPKLGNRSFGSGLFAGALFDPGATSYCYMRNQKEAFVLPVRLPFTTEDVDASPFYVPHSHPISQLSAAGETFHPRSKLSSTFKKLKFHKIPIPGNRYLEVPLPPAMRWRRSDSALVSAYCRSIKSAIAVKSPDLRLSGVTAKLMDVTIESDKSEGEGRKVQEIWEQNKADFIKCIPVLAALLWAFIQMSLLSRYRAELERA